MSDTTKPTRQDDLLTLIRILAEAPMGGRSIAEIQEATTARGDTWSFRTINDLLCGLVDRVKHEKVRVKSGKVTKYQLRSMT